ncbi:GMC family oxidoreductase [Streptomyces sp. L7]
MPSKSLLPRGRLHRRRRRLGRLRGRGPPEQRIRPRPWSCWRRAAGTSAPRSTGPTRPRSSRCSPPSGGARSTGATSPSPRRAWRADGSLVACGKVVGGCSSVNALMWVRGSRHDYTRWVAEGATGWSYDEVLPFFRLAEDYSGGADEFRGAGGPVRVRQLDRPSPIARAFVAGAGELGYATDTDGDYNGARQEGFGFLYQTFRDDAGRRCSTADAYLRPALDRSNLTVLTDTLVTRAAAGRDSGHGRRVRPGRRAAAVARRARSRRVRRGAFETPKLLMLSGIGPAAHLREHGIRCVQDLPGVGAGLPQDPPVHAHLLTSRSRSTRTGRRCPRRGCSPTPARPVLRTPPTSSSPSGPSSSCRPTPPPTTREGPGFAFAPIALRPESRGRTRPRDADPRSTPSSAPGTSPPPPTLKSW